MELPTSPSRIGLDLIQDGAEIVTCENGASDGSSPRGHVGRRSPPSPDLELWRYFPPAAAVRHPGVQEDQKAIAPDQRSPKS